MALEFTCPACGHSYRLAAELGGKLARCKHCKAVNRLPAPAPASAARREGARSRPVGGSKIRAARPPASDPFGFDDAQVTAAAIVPGDLEGFDDSPMPAPRRAPARAPGAARKTSGGEPWGLPARNASIVCTALMLIEVCLQQVLFGRARPADSFSSFRLGLITLVGLVATLVSLVGATVSSLAGNRRAFRSENALLAFGWYGAIGCWTMMVLVIGWVWQSGRLGPRPAGPPPGVMRPQFTPNPFPGPPPGSPIDAPAPFQTNPRPDFPRAPFGPRGPGARHPRGN